MKTIKEFLRNPPPAKASSRTFRLTAKQRQQAVEQIEKWKTVITPAVLG
jgi:hypothetical protein